MASFVFDFSLGLLSLTVLLFFILFLSNRQLDRFSLLALWTGIFVVVATISWFAEPSVYDDLSRHYAIIDQMRIGEAVAYDSSMIVLRFIFKLVSFTSNNGWLPFGAIFVWGILGGGILNSYLKTTEYDTRSILLYFVSAYAGCAVFYMVSGVRSTLASMIWLWSYTFFYPRNKLLHCLICVVFGTLHPITLILLCAQLFYEYLFSKNTNHAMGKMILACMLLFIITRTEIMAIVLDVIPIPYVQMLAGKWTGYMYSSGFSLERILVLVFLFVFIACELYLIKKKKRNVSLLLFFVLVCISTYNMPIFYDRIVYAIGLISFDSLNVLGNQKSRYKSICQYVLLMVFSGKLFFSVYQMISHISFNGVYFRDYISF